MYFELLCSKRGLVSFWLLSDGIFDIIQSNWQSSLLRSKPIVMAHYSFMKAFNIALLLFFCSSSSISLAFQSLVILSAYGKSKHHKITSCRVMYLSSDDDCLDQNPTYDNNSSTCYERPISRTHTSSNSRRSFLSFMTIAATSINFPSLDEPSASSTSYNNIANAAETIGKDESCNDSTCLGVWDGLLADCPHGANKLSGGKSGCVSSQDDTPGVFAEPWDYSDNIPLISNDNIDDIYKSQMDKLILAIQTTSKDHDDTVKIL